MSNTIHKLSKAIAAHADNNKNLRVRKEDEKYSLTTSKSKNSSFEKIAKRFIIKKNEDKTEKEAQIAVQLKNDLSDVSSLTKKDIKDLTSILSNLKKIEDSIQPTNAAPVAPAQNLGFFAKIGAFFSSIFSSKAVPAPVSNPEFVAVQKIRANVLDALIESKMTKKVKEESKEKITEVKADLKGAKKSLEDGKKDLADAKKGLSPDKEAISQGVEAVKDLKKAVNDAEKAKNSAQKRVKAAKAIRNEFATEIKHRKIAKSFVKSNEKSEKALKKNEKAQASVAKLIKNNPNSKDHAKKLEKLKTEHDTIEFKLAKKFAIEDLEVQISDVRKAIADTKKDEATKKTELQAKLKNLDIELTNIKNRKQEATTPSTPKKKS